MRPCFPSNYTLVQSLPTTEPVKRIMSKVDREIFCLHKEGCYCVIVIDLHPYY